MKFGLIGASGYIAPRHMKVIKDLGHELVVALDPNDSVGILDSYFPDCKFFTSQEAFDRHVVKHENLDYVVVCSPNHLHESHCKLGMRLGANVICEKPLATTVENAIQLKTVEEQTGKRVYSILQLRLHPSIKLLKSFLNNEFIGKKHDVKLTYVTPRGDWYFQSWKGDISKSGGLETNIGIHFFDMLMWLFGDVENYEIYTKTEKRIVGSLTLKHAKVSWVLSVDKNDLPSNHNFNRNMIIDGEDIRFDNVFAELHKESYQKIFDGEGFGIDETLRSISIVERMRDIK